MIFNKIWVKDFTGKDLYADFLSEFTVDENKKTVLSVTCDNSFAVWLNGELVFFGQCSDYQDSKEYYEKDVSEYCKKENKMVITVHHEGESNQSYIKGEPFVAFKVLNGEETVCESGETVRCKRNEFFESGRCKKITGQYGYGFFYDATSRPDDAYSSSEITGQVDARKKQIKNLEIRESESSIIEKRENDYLIDLGREKVGFIEFDIDFDCVRPINISFGERLINGELLYKFRDINYTISYKGKKGKNTFIYPFRRIAARYLKVDDVNVKINSIGVRAVEYPFDKIERRFDDPLFQKIYDVGCYTLKCCMHEHYEDCPLREQALYAFDGRNQMLAGYYAFKNPEVQRYNLVLMSRGLRKDGLLDLCFPAEINYPIPFFSLIYPIAVYEYVEHTADFSILGEVGSVIKTIMSTFDKRKRENGLIPRFEKPFWNFYEWSDSSDGDDVWRNDKTEYGNVYELILNCAYVYALNACEKLFNVSTNADITLTAIKDYFYDKNKGVYKLSTQNDKYSQLGNAFACMVGLGTKELCEKIINDKNMIPITLSALPFLYDVLLKVDVKFKKYILNDIKQKYGYMLESGATTFWEVLDVGDNPVWSLCHGWSAMPVYYLTELTKGVEN